MVMNSSVQVPTSTGLFDELKAILKSAQMKMPTDDSDTAINTAAWALYGTVKAYAILKSWSLIDSITPWCRKTKVINRGNFVIWEVEIAAFKINKSDPQAFLVLAQIKYSRRSRNIKVLDVNIV